MDRRLLNEKSLVFANADPHAVSDYVNQHVGAHRILLPNSGHPEASLSHRAFGSLDLCQISYGGRVHVTSPALETLYHLQILLRGHCLWRGRGEEHYFTPGELLLINPDDPVDLTYSDDCEKFIVKLPAILLDKACSENQWRHPGEGVRFAPRHRLEELDGFVNLISLVCQEAEAEQTIPQVQEHFAKIIASKLLGLPGSNVNREPLTAGCPSFERLVEFIENNLKQDISLEQLAELAHMSARSLYALFEKHAGTTPKHYIRQRKLETIHARLSDPQAAVRNVTEVALDYGFLHLGRFSECYKSTFGELPSDTLRRRN
ncbi:AraC family transcriptional regulator [Geopseudomonas aromaticivorans]